MNGEGFTSGGFVIPEFGKRSGLTAIRSKDVNDWIVSTLNILGRMTVVKGNVNAFVYSDSNVHLVLKSLPDETGSGGSGGTVPVRAQITEVGNDYIDCDLWNGTAFDSGNHVKVARPVELRRPAGDTIYGVTVSYSYSDENTRTASSGGFDTEHHKIILPYEIGREILVIDTGIATGVTDATYIDLNISGRTWASVPAIPIP